MRFLILVAGHPAAQVAARRGGYARLIAEAVADAWPGSWSTHDLRSDSPLPGRRDAEVFVITGSSSSVTEREPWMLRSERLVRDLVAARVPLLGICFGHQLMAQALGGEVWKNQRGREIGTVRLDRVADDPLFGGLPRAVDVHQTHVDVVTRLPAGAQVLASTALDAIAAFRVGDRARGVQFHPEFDADVMRGYLQARAQLVREEGGDPDALLGRVHASTCGRQVLRNFARMALSS